MSRSDPRTIRHKGIRYEVLGSELIQHRKYLLLQQLTVRNTQRWLALAQPGSALAELCVLHQLPAAIATPQRLNILRNLSGHVPFLPRILDHEIRPDQVLVVTDWVPGKSLGRYLGYRDFNSRWIHPIEALRLYKGLVQTICGLHRWTGVIHGDINPDNLILRAKSHWLVLIDFGSSWRSLDAAHREEGEGSRAPWSAPEVLDGSPANELADQFSAAAICFQMLTNRTPYDGLGGIAGRLPQQTELWTPPSHFAAASHPMTRHVWTLIDDHLKRTLALNPTSRFSTNREWLNAACSLFTQVRTDVDSTADRWWTRTISRIVQRLRG
ncbi:MAG: serine/threonine-protein kinase [Planctomycetaceae bacterium]